MLPELYIMRHGQTEWNAAGRLQGTRDSPLTEMGKAQARAMGQQLRALGVTGRSHRLIASPQGRAVETARLVLAEIGGQMEIDRDLREISVGDWEGLTMEALARRGVGQRADETRFAFIGRAPGEGYAALWARAGRVLARVSGPAVLVTHGVTSRFLRARALGLDIAGAGELPSGQGVIFRIREAEHETIAP